MKNFTVYNPRVIIEDTLKNGGGTFTLDGDRVSFESGYMVSLWGYEHRESLDSYTEEQIHPQNLDGHVLSSVVGQYMQHVNRHFSNNIDYPVYIGTWINDSVIYLDVSRNIPDRDDAITSARHNKQLAIWDCANQCEIIVG